MFLDLAFHCLGARLETPFLDLPQELDKGLRADLERSLYHPPHVKP